MDVEALTDFRRQNILALFFRFSHHSSCVAVYSNCSCSPPLNIKGRKNQNERECGKVWKCVHKNEQSLLTQLLASRKFTLNKSSESLYTNERVLSHLNCTGTAGFCCAK